MFVKKPSGHHRTFRIIIPGKPLKTLENEELDAINSEFLAGRVSLERAQAQVKALAVRLTPKKPVEAFLPENLALADAFWKATIKPKRGNVAPWEAERRVRWAAKALGSVSIITGTEEQLYEALGHLGHARTKKRAASVINSILRWKGLGKVIHVERATWPEPRYLTYAQVTSFSLRKREWQACMMTAFGTGARYGELFAMTEFSLQEEGSHMLILKQIKEGWELAETKNRKVGTAYIIPECREAAKEWVRVPMEIKQQMRSSGQPGKVFREAAFKALGVEVTFHNLRHSYARCMRTKNEGLWPDREPATLEDLREWMRDQMSTIEKYYTNWGVTSSQMRYNRKRFG